MKLLRLQSPYLANNSTDSSRFIFNSPRGVPYCSGSDAAEKALTVGKLALSQTLSVVLVAVVASFFFSFNLGQNKLASADEAIYAQSAKEMVQSGDWVTPHWNQHPFFQKPPLAIWATALVFKVFGVSEFNARIVSALSAVGCVLLVLLIGRLFLNEWQAITAALVLIATPGFYVYGRMGMTDAPLTVFLLLALFAYLKSRDDERYWILVGLALGLAAMTKGPATLPALLAIGLAMVIGRRTVSRWLWLGAAVFVVTAGVWLGLMVLTHGQPFVSEYWGNQILRRSGDLMDTKAQPWTFYPLVLVHGFLPFVPGFVLGVIAVIRQRCFPAVLAAFALIGLLMYAASPTKHFWYLLPMFPILALIAAPRNRIAWAIYPVLFAVAPLGIMSLNAGREPLRIADAQAVAAAHSRSEGRIYTDINNAPAVLFYTDRRVCTTDARHSMSALARCD